MKHTRFTPSYSESARKLADMGYLFYNDPHWFYRWHRDFEAKDFVDMRGKEAVLFILETSELKPVIRYRAAKRFGRLVRGKSKRACKF